MTATRRLLMWMAGLCLAANVALADVSQWSTTPGSNATITDATCGTINFAEGQAPSTVNDSARATMANVRCWLEDGGWLKWGDTHTYATATTTTVSGDVTARYAAGRRVRAVGTTTGTIYGLISASSYSAPNTTVTYIWDGASNGLVSETLTIALGQHSATQPTPAAFKGAVNYAKASAITSASTVDLGAANGNVVHITGTTGISSFGTAPQAGTVRLVIFDAALAITHGSNLNLPGAANITTAANDWLLAVADTTTKWYAPIYQKADGTPVVSAASVPTTPLGQAQLVYTNTTTLTLDRYNGSYLFINGANKQIPSTAPTLGTGGLSSSTVYYVYAYMSGATMTLEASTTTYATDGTYGHKIKSGDATRSLVGIIRTDGSTQFASADAQRFVRSWHNPQSILNRKANPENVGFTSGAAAEISSSYRVEFVAFAEDLMTAGTMGTFYNSGANSTYVYIYLDGATQVTGGAGITGTTNQTPYGGFGTATLTSGYHYVSMWGAVGAGTGTLAGVSATLDVSLKRAN